jgi:hypothetical protein
MDDENIIDLILLIKKRLPMYLNRNSIICLRSFLGGWYFNNTVNDVKIEILKPYFTNLKLLYPESLRFSVVSKAL